MLHQKELSILERLKAHDITTYNHSMHVAEMAKEFATYLVNQTNIADKRGFVERVYNAACVHDAGKLTIPYEIINKPGSLTEAERVLMSEHSSVAPSVLDGFPEVDITVALEHHMHYKEGISLESQIIAVCDVYSAIALERSYSSAKPPAYAVEEMKKCKKLNPEVANLFDSFSREAGYYERGLPVGYQPKTQDDCLQMSIYYLSSKYHLSSEFMQVTKFRGNEFVVYNDISTGDRIVLGTLKPGEGIIDTEPHEVKLLNKEQLFQRSIDWSRYEDKEQPDVADFEAGQE